MVFRTVLYLIRFILDKKKRVVDIVNLHTCSKKGNKRSERLRQIVLFLNYRFGTDKEAIRKMVST